MRRKTCNAVKRLLIGCLLLLAACGQEPGIPEEPINTITSTVAPTETLTEAPTPTETPTPTPVIDIPISEEYFPDVNFRTYLYEYADINKDRILSLEEREAVTRIQNDFDDYDKSASWNEGNADVDYYDYITTKYLMPLCDVENLQGIEYFPNLYEIQLVGMNMSGDVIVTNPLLGVFKLTYEGDAITIDLTACEKLHTCVVCRSSEEKPTILLPKHLEVTPLERISPYGNTYYDCVVGETARQWHSGEW